MADFERTVAKMLKMAGAVRKLKDSAAIGIQVVLDADECEAILYALDVLRESRGQP